MNKLLFIILFFASCSLAHRPSKEFLDNYAKYEEYYENSNYEQALPYAKKVLDFEIIDLGKNHEYYGIFSANLAELYVSMGDFNKALPLYLEALENLESTLGNENSGYVTVLVDLADLYKNLGEYETSLPLYLEALELIENGLGKKNPAYFVALGDLASLYQSMGDYEKALPLFLEVLENTKNTLGKEHSNYGTDLNNLALFYLDTEEFEKALPMFLEAKEITENTLGTENSEFGASLNNLANLYQSIGEYEKALPLYLEALEIAGNTVGKSHPDYGNCLNSLAALYKRMGEYEKALPLFLENIENTEKVLGKDHPEYGNYLNHLAALYQKMGEYELAMPLIEQANQNLLGQMAQIFRFRSEQEKVHFLQTILYYFDMYQSFDYLTKNQFSEIRVLNLNNQLILKGLLANTSRAVFEDLQQLGDPTIDLRIKSFKSTKTILARQYSLPVGQRRFSVDSLSQISESQEAELVSIHNSKFGQTQTFIANWKEVQAKLKLGEVAVEFSDFHYLDQKSWTDSILYVAYVIKPETETPEVVYLFEEKTLDEVVKTQSPNGLYALRGAEEVDQNFYLLSEEMYNLIWAPLEPYLSPGDVVYYSPSGKLNQIAMGAIPDSTGNLALTKYTLYQNNSTYNLVKGNEQPENAPAIFAGGIVYDFSPKAIDSKKEIDAIYNPTTLLADAKRNLRGSTWKYLDGTKSEALSLEEFYLKNNLIAKLIGGEEATEGWFKSLDGNSPKVLHLATHGFFFENPKRQNLNTTKEPVYTLASDPLMRSGLLLAHSNYAWQNGDNPYEEEDGILTAYEISHMDLRKTDLVVLSACETGLGDIEGSEGVYGLQRAFKMAGVDYIIMSLWSVPDKETAEFMQLFYGYWLGGIEIRNAFNQTQRDMSAQYKSQPEKWAAFVLVE